VNVGLNLTAVATYSAGHITYTEDNGEITNTYSGTTTAVVANSGSNTVSILNLVNPTSVLNVTVGNQPVALTVSADGSTSGNVIIEESIRAPCRQVRLTLRSRRTRSPT